MVGTKTSRRGCGQGISKDTSRAVEYLNRAADEGEPLALYKLGALALQNHVRVIPKETAVDLIKWSARKQVGEAAGKESQKILAAQLSILTVRQTKGSRPLFISLA